MNARFFLVKILTLGLLLSLIACNDSTNINSSTPAQTANVTPKSTNAKQQNSTKKTTPKPKMSSKGIVLNLKSSEVKSGGEVCVDVSVKDFVQVVSMQYSINWDANSLKFKDLRGINLKDLTKGNFGKTKIEEGKLTFSWYDQAVQGINVADNTVIYQLCFDAIGKGGTKSKVRITEDPIIVEITGAGGTHLKCFPETSHVRIK